MTVIKHVSVGSTLTQAEWEADETHTVDGSTSYTFLTSTGGTFTGDVTAGASLIASSSFSVAGQATVSGSLVASSSASVAGKLTAGSATVTGSLAASSSASIAEHLTLTKSAWISGSLADGYYSGLGEKGTAGAALAIGDLCYFSTADSRWELADASTESTCKQKLGICVLVAAGDGSTTALLRWGNVRADAAFPTLDIGMPVFVSITAGDITSTGSPTATGEIMRRVGTANTANELALEISNEYYTVTT
jgi:cytoskeletal protein CcmA (bactofilin family)